MSAGPEALPATIVLLLFAWFGGGWVFGKLISAGGKSDSAMVRSFAARDGMSWSSGWRERKRGPHGR